MAIFNKIKNKSSIHIFIVIAAGVLAYSNTFHVPFLFDDTLNIVENPLIKDFQYFTEPLKAKEFSLYDNGFKSRFIGYLSFALNYRLHGLDVTGYHIVNLAIHILNALLVYWLVLLTLFRVSKGQSVKVSERQSFDTLILGRFDTKFVALFSALIFISHPIQTQAVTYIVQRFTSLATMFYLLSLVLYIKWRLKKEGQGSGSKGQGLSGGQLAVSNKLTANRYLLYTASLICAVLAMETKEIAFTLPIIIVLYECCFFTETFNFQLLTLNFKKFLFLIPFFLTMFIIPFALIKTDKLIGNMVAGIGEVAKSGPLSRWDYFSTQTRVIMTYIRLLLFPINQTIDYDYPVSYSFFDLNVFLSFLFLLSILGLGIYFFYRSRITNNKLRVMAFGIFWFFITLSVESSVIPIVDVIFEHRVYLPSVGLIIAFVSFIFYAFCRIPHSAFRIPVLLLTTSVIVLSIAAYQRNTVWYDAITLWMDVAKKNPANARAYNMIGVSFFDEGDINSAILNFREAVRVKPDYTQAHSNLGAAYMETGMLEKAEKELFFSLYLSQYIQPVDNIDMASIHTSIGNYYFKKGLYDNAIEYYNNALNLFPENAQVYFNLGRAYNQKGHRDMSGWYFNKAHTLDPGKY